jgi:hypothetical protein
MIMWYFSITRQRTYPLEGYRTTFFGALLCVVLHLWDATGFDIRLESFDAIVNDIGGMNRHARTFNTHNRRR